jgi:four helix bundle protein
MGIVEEEADECLYWLDLLVESHTASAEQVAELLQEADEVVSMTVASIRTARGRRK